MVERVRMAASRWVKVMNLKKLAHQVWMALDSMVVESEEGHGFLEPQDGSKASEKACSMNQFTVIPVPFLIAARWRLTEQILYRFAGRKTRCCVRARFNNVTPSLLHTTAFVFPRTGKLSKGTRLKKETARVSFSLCVCSSVFFQVGSSVSHLRTSGCRTAQQSSKSTFASKGPVSRCWFGSVEWIRPLIIVPQAGTTTISTILIGSPDPCCPTHGQPFEP